MDDDPYIGDVSYTGCSCCDNDPSCDHEVRLSHLKEPYRSMLKAAIAAERGA